MIEHTYLNTNVEEQVHQNNGLSSFKNIYRVNKKNSVKHWVLGILIILLIVLFLPWTQNITAKGLVTTLRQADRPQELNTILAVSVKKWYVNEGDYVKAGDTILQLGEVKVDYFDPQLLSRTQQQIVGKSEAHFHPISK